VNKRLVVILIILIVIGIGASFFVKRAPQTLTKQLSPVSKLTPTVVPKETMQGTLRNLIYSKKPQVCTYSNKLGTVSVSGTVFIADGKMKADFATVSAENKINGHIVINNGYTYIWTGTTNKGIKVVFDPNQSAGLPINSQAPDLNQSFTYVCKDWVKDASLFTPPTNIDFSLISVPAMLPSGAVAPSSGAVTNESACLVCDKLPAGESQTACRAQFQCQ
jgi:hypothetical protein